MAERLRGATRETFKSLHTRNFRLFFFGQFISQVGNWLTLVAQTLLVLHLTNSGVAVGMLTACQFAPVLLFGAWTGLIADRSDKRKLLLIVQTFAMVQSFALAALAFSGNPPVWAIYAVAACGGLALAFDNPARRAFVVEMVPEEDVQNAVSLNSAQMTSSRIFGPALAGLLASTVGFGWCFTVDGLSYIAVLASLWMMRPSELRPSPVAIKAKGQIRAGLRYVRNMPDLLIPMVMMAIVGTLAFNFSVVMPLFIERTFHGDDGTFTIFFSVLSIGSLIGALWTARRKEIYIRDLVVASFAFGITMLLLASSPSLALAFPLAIMMGIGSIGFLTASTAIVQVRADPAMRGRVLALQAMVFLGSTPIGGPIVGAISDYWGARAGVAIGGIACLVAAAIGLAAVRREEAGAIRPGPVVEPEAVDDAIELEPA
jgi:MFS family permease